MIRQLTRATVTGALAALVADLLLQFALSMVRVDGSSGQWFIPTLLERGRWVVAAGLLWFGAPLMSPDTLDEPRGAGSPLWLDVVGRAMIALPVIWLSATVIVRAMRLTVEGSWPYEGRVFLTSDFYASAIVGYAPWALGGLAVLALARHAGVGD